MNNAKEASVLFLLHFITAMPIAGPLLYPLVCRAKCRWSRYVPTCGGKHHAPSRVSAANCKGQRLQGEGRLPLLRGTWKHALTSLIASWLKGFSPLPHVFFCAKSFLWIIPNFVVYFICTYCTKFLMCLRNTSLI